MVRTAFLTGAVRSGRRATASASGSARGKTTAKSDGKTSAKSGGEKSAKSGTGKGGKAAARTGRGKAARTGDATSGRSSRSARSGEKVDSWMWGRKSASKKPSSASGGRTAAAARDAKVLPLPVRLLVMLLAFAAMVAFAAVLARLTLEPSPASEALVHSNLHPGRSLHAYLSQPEFRDAVKQVGGNLLLGVPFGILMPTLAPKTRGFLRVLVLTALVMLLVELAQGAFVTGRAFDIDDVILNTSGALVGYLLLGRRLGRAVHPKRRRA